MGKFTLYQNNIENIEKFKRIIYLNGFYFLINFLILKKLKIDFFIFLYFKFFYFFIHLIL